MRVFVSVGTTKFDDLIAIFSESTILHAIYRSGVTHLTIQHGASPVNIPSDAMGIDMEISVFDYAPSLKPYLEVADVVFSHAATGIYLDSLQFQVPHFLVVNTTLHENHQTEFAELFDNKGRCRAFMDSEHFRHYLLSERLAEDVPSMRKASPAKQSQTPPALLVALSNKPHAPGVLGLLFLVGFTLWYLFTI